MSKSHDFSFDIISLKPSREGRRFKDARKTKADREARAERLAFLAKQERVERHIARIERKDGRL